MEDTQRLPIKMIGKLLQMKLAVLQHVQTTVLPLEGFIANTWLLLRMNCFPSLKQPVSGHNYRMS